MIGRTLSHYKVLEELSRGGMGIVYRALDLKLDREVALKVLPPELVADPRSGRNGGVGVGDGEIAVAENPRHLHGGDRGYRGDR